MAESNGRVVDPAGVTVGVVANPASGRDIRRLVAGASVFDNAEKGNMVYRLMAGLGSLGVGKILMMPAASGLYDSLEKNIRTHGKGRRLPHLELVEMMVWHGAQDSITAVEAMVERGVSAIAVLGGDGTSRIVARHCGDVPLIPLSTGTNNAFPEMREATVAGLALGLLVTGKIAADRVLKSQKVLRVGVNDDSRRDLALVDVAASSERFVGSRALWKPGTVTELIVAAASPDAVGLSSVAGLLDPVARDAPHGLYLRLSEPEKADNVVNNVPLSPGLVIGLGVREYRRIEAGEEVRLDGGFGSIALDGEREIERGERDAVTATLDLDGPRTLDVRETMRIAAEEGLLRE